MISVDDARARVLERSRPLPGTDTVPLAAALGRVLAAPLRADRDDPPFARALMDGYALRAGETPGTLRVVARIAAGDADLPTLAPGDAAWINTGAPVPPGADAVVPVERTDAATYGTVTVPDAVAPSANILPRGTLAAAGDVVVEGRLTPERVGVCASIGALDVTVRRRPRVAVFATGTELNQAPGRHEIRNSNGPMLCALLAGAGYDVLDLDSVGDDRALLDAAFERALDAADVVVTTGGVSKGEHDLVRPALEAGGVEIAVHGVSLQPGKPLLFGRRGDRACFGLPGNPASSLVCADVFLLPYLAALAGRDPNDALVESRARVSAPVQASRKRRRVFPCRRSPDGVDPLPWRSSADLYMLTRGNGYVVIAAGADLAAGDEALVWIPERFGAA